MLSIVRQAVSTHGSATKVGFTRASSPLAAPLVVERQVPWQTVTTRTSSDEAAGRRSSRDGTLDALVTPTTAGCTAV